MPDLRLDDCVHCACVTQLSKYTREQAIKELEEGSLGCWNCLDHQEEGENDGHCACVILYDGEQIVWDGRCRK